MANNHVVLSNGTTLIDLRDTTAAASDVMTGKYFYTAAGVKTEGTNSGGTEAGMVSQDANGYLVFDDDPGTHIVPNFATVTKSYTPSESQQTDTVTIPSGYNGIEEVDISVGAISSSYVGSGITRRSSSDLTASGATVTAPAGYYASAASKSVTSGTAGTPTATKGTVSNHSVSVTPSVTNTAGYITGGTKTGTAVTVSASELVSGSETKTSNGTYNVTNLAELIVNVSGGGGGGLTPIYTDSVYASTTSTSTTTVLNTTLTGLNDPDTLLVAVCTDHDGKRNGYFYGSVSVVYIGASNTKYVWYTRIIDDGTESSAQGSYGVFFGGFSTSITDGSATAYFSSRYNVNYTGTIDGTFDIKVYLLPLSSLR